MRRALLILFLGLVTYSCEEKCCFKQQYSREELQPDLKITQQSKHSVTNKNCNLMLEWLNRKNIGHFLKNHISLVHTPVVSIDKNL
ncbi:hypothetical protein SAMN05421813_12918 [Daejeonella rubra]|uniref:Uncharacterized protein n=1 Tax=Daejeonella rubra TaxID=990371 RepID=A0A1G9X8B0_9SPHI|nr:hypothetical protein [Daejeonella rubra]SDM92887.1 hypothetical protein SAMN05421813_12918 [Daejeonella rubra]